MKAGSREQGAGSRKDLNTLGADLLRALQARGATFNQADAEALTSQEWAGKWRYSLTHARTQIAVLVREGAMRCAGHRCELTALGRMYPTPLYTLTDEAKLLTYSNPNVPRKTVRHRLASAAPQAQSAGRAGNEPRKKQKNHGGCDPPHNISKCLLVGSNLPEHDLLETAIHEALHACLWDLDEDSVDQTAADIARFLRRMGFKIG